MALKLVPRNAHDAPAAVGGYAQAFDVEGASRLLFVSGQIPESADGHVPEGFEAQAAQVWANVLAQLRQAGLTVRHLVKVTTYLSSRQYAVANRAARQAALEGHTPALTVIITGIFDERWLLEIEAIAAA
jgi:2-iminobutanoate/2-iminopropanoate deaminase